MGGQRTQVAGRRRCLAGAGRRLCSSATPASRDSGHRRVLGLLSQFRSANLPDWPLLTWSRFIFGLGKISGLNTNSSDWRKASSCGQKWRRGLGEVQICSGAEHYQTSMAAQQTDEIFKVSSEQVQIAFIYDFLIASQSKEYNSSQMCYISTITTWFSSKNHIIAALFIVPRSLCFSLLRS